MNGVTILFVYAVIMILATVILTKKEKNVERFCVGSRSENWLMSALSIAATWIWAPALFVSTEKAYSTGWVGLFWFLVPNALCLVIFIPFAKRIRKEMPEGMTLSGYMKEKYKSDGVKRVYLFQLIGLSVLSTGVQLLAGSQILSAVTGISFKTMTILLACIAISYSLFSGIKASMLTDAIQMVFMLVACSLFVIFGVRNTGTQGIIQGLSGISGDCATLFSGKGVEIFLAFGLPTTIGLLSGPFGDQSFWQRAFAVKKEKLGRAFLLGSVLFAVVPLSMGILGFMGAGAGYQAQNLGIINFELIRHFFPSWAVLPFLFMIVSGLLSTVDSNLHIEETVSKKELDSLAKKTVKDIKEKCKGKKAAYAWSAGKDSLVLGEICEKAGIDQSVLVRCNLEYPAFIAWIEQNKPSGLEVINTGQDMEWLKKHPDMLFPDKSNKAAQWFHIVQHRGQARYYKEHQLEILLLGRRKADGNYVGKDNIYTNSAGITRYSPLAEWRHEDILAYIHYYDVKLPPIYDWEKGYLCGTHPWPARQYMETERQGWKEVYDIDKTIVENAAQHFDGAREFLKAIK